MLLAIDIGNSSIKFGVFDDKNLVRRLTVPTIRTQNADEIYQTIHEQIDQEFSALVISSVVPELNGAFRTLGEKYYHQTPVFVENHFDFGLLIRYDPPGSLGVDRILAAFAAVRKYGSPVIVCDFGTATTIDAVSAGNEFLGGIIAPGVNTFSEILHLKTSKLPRVEIRKPESVIGNSTVGAIQSGIFYGYLGLTEGILRRMTAELSEKPKVAATGGFANLMAESCDLIDFVDENLILEGLRLVFENSLRN